VLCDCGTAGGGPLGGVSLLGSDPCLDHRFVFVLELDRSILLPLSPDAKIETDRSDGARALCSGVPKENPEKLEFDGKMGLYGSSLVVLVLSFLSRSF
jgi:hypothetical protein